MISSLWQVLVRPVWDVSYAEGVSL
jgi:hypothetical protein